MGTYSDPICSVLFDQCLNRLVAEDSARVAVKLRRSVNGSMIGGGGVGQRVRVAFDGGCKYGFGSREFLGFGYTGAMTVECD